MKKLIVLLVFFLNTVLFAQSKINRIHSFSYNGNMEKFDFLKSGNYTVDYHKYLNFPVEFSIYNPKPGFTPTKIEAQRYYSFTNTNLLLKREMSNKEPEPIYPSQDKKKSFGEAIFSDVLEGVFSKK